MENNNSLIIQSRIITAARYDYSVQEQRILFLIMDMLQKHVDGKDLKKRYSVSETLFGDYDFSVPLSSFMKEDEQNHSLVKKSLDSMENKSFILEDEESWEKIKLLERVKFYKKESYATFRIHPLLATAFLDFSKGYSKYSLEVTKEFKSVYAMRFYMLFSTQSKSINYGVDTLKLMFGLEDKYTGKTNDFERFVILSAKKELDRVCPISFNYKKYPEKGKIKGYTFYPYKTGIKDPVMENDLKNQMSIRWDLDLIFVNYLKENFGFLDKELKNNIKLLNRCQTELEDFAMTLSKIKAKVNETQPTIVQGYVINALKFQLDQLEPSTNKVKKRAEITSNNSQISAPLINLAKSKTIKK